MPVCPFYFGVPSILKPDSREKGTLIVKGLLRNLDTIQVRQRGVQYSRV